MLEPQRTAAILLADNSIAIEHHCSQQLEKAKHAPGDTMKEKSRTDLEKTTTNQPNKKKKKSQQRRCRASFLDGEAVASQG